MRSCLLYIGPPRCGPSRIWDVLRQRDRLLAENDIFVPASGRAKNGSHTILVHVLADMPVRAEDAIFQQDFAKELETQPRGRVVIASEQLWQILPNPDRSARILGKLRSFGLDVSLAMHPRNQPQLFNALCAYGLRSFNHDTSFERFVDWASQGTNKFRFKRWIDIADQLKVGLLTRPFSERASGGGFFLDFLRLIGAPVRSDQPERMTEPTFGPLAADIARHLLRHCGGPTHLTPKQWGNLGRALREEIEALGIAEPPYCGLTPEMTKQIEDHFRADNNTFAAAAWGMSWKEAVACETSSDIECNDYEIVGMPPDRRDAHRQVLATMTGKLNLMLANGALAPGASGDGLKSRPADSKSIVNELWRLLPGGTRAPARPEPSRPHPFGTPYLVPLHSEGFPLVLMYSQKSGCTSIVKWFLFQIDKLDEALRFNAWVHEYRVEVLLNRPGYMEEALRLVSAGELPVLKLARNPYDRAVSSFLHIVERSRKKTRGPWEQALIVDARTRAGKSSAEIPSLSFLDFMRHVAAVGANHDRMNAHVAQQFVPVEERVTPRVIKLEQFKEEIRRLESEIGLKQSPVTAITQSDHHKPRVLPAVQNDPGSAAETEITDLMIMQHQIPLRHAFYNEETRELVRTAYANDFKAYGYEP